MSSNSRVTKTRPIEPPPPPAYNPDLPVAQQVLSTTQAAREVVQDFCPLAQSLEWELGQQYLRDRGNKAFISDASPGKRKGVGFLFRLRDQRKRNLTPFPHS